MHVIFNLWTLLKMLDLLNFNEFLTRICNYIIAVNFLYTYSIHNTELVK